MSVSKVCDVSSILNFNPLSSPIYCPSIKTLSLSLSLLISFNLLICIFSVSEPISNIGISISSFSFWYLFKFLPDF